MTPIQKLRLRIAQLIAPHHKGRSGQRMYQSAQTSRLTEGWATSQTSADAELHTSLRTMRQRSRALIRDFGYPKRSKMLVVNNVIGPGIGMQAQVKTTRDELNERINAEIEAKWELWSAAENCHTGGGLHFSDLERFVMGQVFEAGECFIRKHYRAFGNSEVPYALEVIEPERVIDEFQPQSVSEQNKVRLGIEMDAFHRPVAYWIRTVHPGETFLTVFDRDRIERVPAEQIIHMRIVDRWPQTRGVPWMHATLRKINDMDGYTEAEIIRARGEASKIGALKTSREYGDTGKDANGNFVNRTISSEPGTYEILYQDEELQFPPSSSPNPSADPFLRFLLREFSAGTGPSYESISRDYSQSNYSSSRLSLLDDRDLWRVYQLWFIRNFRQPVHRDWMQAAVLSRSLMTINVEQYALNPEKFIAVRYKPRGWSWVDPTKEVEAYKEAIKSGLTTQTDVIAQTANGRDIEDILEERKRELDMAKKKGLVFDTDPDMLKQKIEKKQTPDNQNVQDDSGGQNNGQGNSGDDAGRQKRKTLPFVPHRA